MIAKKSGWHVVADYDCFLDEKGYIKYLRDIDGNIRYLWAPDDRGLNAIPACSTSRFRRGLKTGKVIIR